MTEEEYTTQFANLIGFPKERKTNIINVRKGWWCSTCQGNWPKLPHYWSVACLPYTYFCDTDEFTGVSRNGNGAGGGGLGGSVGWAPNFRSGHDLPGCDFEPRVGLCADGSEPGACFEFCVFLSLPLPCLSTEPRTVPAHSTCLHLVSVLEVLNVVFVCSVCSSLRNSEAWTFPYSCLVLVRLPKGKCL